MELLFQKNYGRLVPVELIVRDVLVQKHVLAVLLQFITSYNLFFQNTVFSLIISFKSSGIVSFSIGFKLLMICDIS